MTVVCSSGSLSSRKVPSDEIALSPHRLNRSQGSSADAGAPLERGYGDRARFQEALRGTDFAAVIRSAPRETPERRR